MLDILSRNDREPGVEVRRQVIFGGVSRYHLAAAKPATAILGRFLEAIRRERRRLGLNKRSEDPLAGHWRLLVATVRSRARPVAGPGAATGAGWTSGTGELAGVPQSRPNPRGGSMLSSSARSSMQIASSLCASTDSVRLSGRLSSHP